MRFIGITGSEGLIGTALASALLRSGFGVRRLDVRLSLGHPGRSDIRNGPAVRRFVAGCHGIIHLAAVSRVLWGERDPERCLDTNVGGTRHVLAAAVAAKTRPWVVLASSREVYGQASALPVDEDEPLRPLNVYGRSKALAGAGLLLTCRGAAHRGPAILQRLRQRDRPPRSGGACFRPRGGPRRAPAH